MTREEDRRRLEANKRVSGRPWPKRHAIITARKVFERGRSPRQKDLLAFFGLDDINPLGIDVRDGVAYRSGLRIWTAEDDEKLKTVYPHQASAALPEVFGRSLPSINKRAQFLGLKKTADYMAVVENQHKNKTHCINGHELSGDNVYVYETKDGGIGRACRKCATSRMATRRNTARMGQLVVAGLNTRQYATRITWAKRRDKNGPTGMTEESLRTARIAIKKAQVKVPRRTHCYKGHPLTRGNFKWTRRKSDGRRYRQCLICYVSMLREQRKIRDDKIFKKRWLKLLFKAAPDLGGTHEQMLKVLAMRKPEQKNEDVKVVAKTGLDTFVLDALMRRTTWLVNEIATVWQLQLSITGVNIDFDKSRGDVMTALNRLARQKPPFVTFSKTGKTWRGGLQVTKVAVA